MATDLATTGSVSLVGESDAIRAVRGVARRVAVGGAKVLLTGESGVGKDVVARYIHAHSPREARPFVTVNCAAISETLLESELFGHVKGSFTGAYRDKVGRLQLGHRGTVFLDELGETSSRMQALLLRFLESGEIYPVGSDALAATVDVRVIAATNRELESLVRSGQFREDLLYRVKVVHLHVPPLREHTQDLPALIEHMVHRVGRPVRFTTNAVKFLQAYHWPGNVRELHNVVEQVSWIAVSEVIDVEELQRSVRFAVAQPVVDRERSRQFATDLYDGLREGQLTFWEDIYARFLQRDMTRDDLRELVRCGLSQAGGNYRAMLPLLGISAKDYKRFLNFLAAHDCMLDFRAFRRSPELAGSEG
jgi:transcriptional regulator with PAS, ATPase and Fis domain